MWILDLVACWKICIFTFGNKNEQYDKREDFKTLFVF